MFRGKRSTHDERREFVWPLMRRLGRPAAPTLVVGALGLLVACSHERGDTNRAAWLESVRFTEVTTQAGIARDTQSYDAGIADHDGDGRLDVYVGNHGSGAVLLRNQGDGTFRDVLPQSGIAPGGDQHGMGFADVDGDGALDIYVAVGANRGLGTKANFLYRNRGDGTFEDIAASAGVTDPQGRSRSVAWLDFDGDGAMDLLLANFASPSRLYQNRGDGTFIDRSADSGLADHPATRVTWTDFDADGKPDILLGGTARGLLLLHNEGAGRFRDVTEQAGLANVPQPAMGMAFGDYDGDGDLDLALSRGVDFTENVLADGDDRLLFAFFAHEQPTGFDFEATAGSSPAFTLYENGSPARPERIRCGNTSPSAPGRFTCAPSGSESSTGADGTPSFLLWHDDEQAADCPDCPAVVRWHLRWSGQGDHHLSGFVEGARHPEPIGLRTDVPRGSSVWRNDDGTFRLAFESGNGLPREAAVNGQAVQWIDVDNDGWLDLYLVDSGVDGRGARNVLLMNDRGKAFVAAREESGAGPDSGAGRGVGAHSFDFDSDGRLDVFLTNGWGAPPFDRGPYRLLRNTTTSGRWLSVRLHGKKSNSHGLGAWLDVEACDMRRRAFNNGGASFYSQSVTPVHFGLGSCNRVTSLKVTWPSQRTQTLQDVPADQSIDIEEEP